MTESAYAGSSICEGFFLDFTCKYQEKVIPFPFSRKNRENEVNSISFLNRKNEKEETNKLKKKFYFSFIKFKNTSDIVPLLHYCNFKYNLI